MMRIFVSWVAISSDILESSLIGLRLSYGQPAGLVGAGFPGPLGAPYELTSSTATACEGGALTGTRPSQTATHRLTAIKITIRTMVMMAAVKPMLSTGVKTLLLLIFAGNC